MSKTPDYLKDANELISDTGFKTSNIWYHGTSSALVNAIEKEGLKRSGDKAIKEAAKKTMATIGNSYSESTEPVFLTQSSELAYYWAKQTVRNRSVRIEGEEKPVIFSITLPNSINDKVRPDVGAASLLMLQEGEDYLLTLMSIYSEHGMTPPQINLMTADRLDYLHKLGMAYFDGDIDAEYISLLTE